MGVGRKIAWGFTILVTGVLLSSIGLVAPLRWVPPPTTAFIERAGAERGADAVHYQWVDWDEIDPHLAVCVLTAEDQRFPEHRGFDIESIRAALKEQRERKRGASTITQQVAKNLYLSGRRSLVRKALEAWFTVWLETLLPKQRILEIYLNVAEFGPGIYGVGAASERLLATTPSQLTRRESALLTAVLPSPRRMHADRPSEYVEGRVAEIEYAANRWGYRYRQAFGLPRAPATASAPDGLVGEGAERLEVEAAVPRDTDLL
jgi:monofunctional biosynthetic peptidoglycan transglycosylase